MPQGSFLYNRVYGALLSRIREGYYASGEKLPNPEELRNEFGISTITLNKALGMLAENGLVRRVPGRGTYVCAANGCAPKVSGQDTEEPFIGVVLEHVATPFGLDMLYHLDYEAERAGYRLLARFSYGEQEKEAGEIEFLRAKGAAGIILMPCHGKHYSQTVLKLYLEGYPLVLVDKRLNGILLPSVRTDNRAAVAELVRALHAKGARRMAFVSASDEEVASVRERCQGFREQTRGMELPEPAWFWIPFGRDHVSYRQSGPGEETLAAARAFLRGAKGNTDAVIAAEYGFVPVLIRAAHAEGIRFGSDMMLASIDGDELSPYGMPYPYMKQNEEEIAVKAMELLVGCIRGEPVAREDYLIAALYRPGSGVRES